MSDFGCSCLLSTLTSSEKIQFSDVFCVKIVELRISTLSNLDSGKVLLKTCPLSGIFLFLKCNLPIK